MRSTSASVDYVTRVHSSPLEINAAQWNALLAASDAPTPFMRHEYLVALHSSGSACAATGWQPQFVSLYNAEGSELLASAPMYVKDHSYGEYIFDWAWARAYQEHGLRYYPKAVVAVPYTPVPGTRFICQNALQANEIMRKQLLFCEQNKLSSLHGLFISDADKLGCDTQKLMARQTVQFHWTNMAPTLATTCAALPPEGARFALGRPGGKTDATQLIGQPYGSFDHYLSTLAQDKRKKIRAERRKVQDAGITWKTSEGAAISASEWEFFYRCYERTYLEHGNAPYLTPEFFGAMAHTMPENWVMFTAQHSGQPIACSLIAIQTVAAYVHATGTTSSICLQNGDKSPPTVRQAEKIAYGRYWGALARVDS
ncbi:MAG: GNAT family N-acetyltransferase, partial [Burkholderiaceae bacterium]